jgi:6-phosphogluconolactonase (cycloisomerase 2 family)
MIDLMGYTCFSWTKSIGNHSEQLSARVIVANYGSGSVAVLPIAADGSLKNQHQLVTLPGEPGPHKVEQVSSHPHDIFFDPSGRFLRVPDKGLDRVFVFRFDGVNGRLSPAEQPQLRRAQGPAPAIWHFT